MSNETYIYRSLARESQFSNVKIFDSNRLQTESYSLKEKHSLLPPQNVQNCSCKMKCHTL